MNYEIVEALGAIVRDKQIDKEFLLQTVKEGLASAVKRKMRARRNLDNVDVEIDQKNGQISIVMVKKVVDEIEEDEYEEILIEEAREIDPDAQIGAFITIRIPYESFGRNAIQTAKQVIVQKIREAERDRVVQEYTAKIGEIVTGTVQQISRGNLIINLGRAEGVLRSRQQIRRERYRQGDRMRAMVLNVHSDAKRDPMIELSRNHPGMLARLFTSEVPEISEGVVEIKAVAREAGDRAKIAVFSNDPSIDPVGACVGIKGSRVLSVAQEFNGEKIDIIQWDEDRTLFLKKALSPARVTEVMIDESTDQSKVTVVVQDDQLSLAIGRAGQNARLAARLTGFRIDIISETEYREIMEEIGRRDIGVADIPGFEPEMAELFRAAGYETLRDLSGINEEMLLLIPGVEAATAPGLLEAIQAAFLRFDEDEEEPEEGSSAEASSAEAPPTEAAPSEEPVAEVAVETESEEESPAVEGGEAEAGRSTDEAQSEEEVRPE